MNMKLNRFWKSSKYFKELLNKFSPLKTKVLRANHSKFITKEVAVQGKMRHLVISKSNTSK